MSARTRRRPVGPIQADEPQPIKAGPKEHSEWAMGPVAAAVLTGAGSIFAAIIIRWQHLPPVLGLAAGVLLAAALVFAGLHRKPRPLAARSLLYRAAAAATVGVWIWAVTVDWDQTGLRGLTGLAILAAAAILILAGWINRQRTVVRNLLVVGGLLAGAVGFAVWSTSTGSAVFTDAADAEGSGYLVWLRNLAMSAGAIATLFVIIGSSFDNHERTADTAFTQSVAAGGRNSRAVTMAGMLATELNTKAFTIKVKPWDNGAGESYHIDGSASGITAAQVASTADAIASRMKLPTRCGIEVVPGKTHAEIVMQVALVDRLCEEYPPPPCPARPRSVYEQFPVGVLRASESAGMCVREHSTFIWGQTGSGKTTQLNNAIKGLQECGDVLTIALDYNGGGVALPWMLPWLLGKVDRPAFEWVIDNAREARIAMDIVYEWAMDRKRRSNMIKREANTTLFPVSRDHPQIVIVVDECKQVIGADAYNAGAHSDRSYVCKKIEQIMSEARDVGITFIFAGLSATEETISRFAKSLCYNRIGMRVTDTAELAYGMDNDHTLKIEQVDVQGAGFFKVGTSRGRVFKGFNQLPSDIEQTVLATAKWRPPMDEHCLRIGGRAFAERWIRTSRTFVDAHGRPMLDPDDPRIAVPAGPAEPTGAGTVQAPAPAAAAVLAPPDPNDLPYPPLATDALSEAMTLLRAAADAADGGQPSGPWATGPADQPTFGTIVGNEWGSDISQWPSFELPTELEQATNPDGPRVLEQLVRQHGPAGIRNKDIHAAIRDGGSWGEPLKVSKNTVNEWLRKANWYADRSDRYAPYVHVDYAPGADRSPR